MLTDKKIAGKLERIERRYTVLRFQKIADIPMELAQTATHFRQEPGKDANLKWREAAAGTRWGGDSLTAWFRGSVRLPKSCDGKKVFIGADTGGETLFLVDNEHRGVFDSNHPVVMMALRGKAGRSYRLAFEAYSGHFFQGCGPDDVATNVETNSRTFNGVRLMLAREDVIGFIHDLNVLRQLASLLDDNSLRRGRIMRCMEKVFATVDAMPAETDESSWRPKLAAARESMRPVLALKNGPTVPWLGIIGHSHIDTAWLWTLAETWRKCARTFSSVLNLMEQYPEFMFLQSQPCQTEVIRREYPGIFMRMKKMVKAGRWEPNGAMWVEPDCNIPSGESFVRQLLVGQTATREMFGYTSDTLWLPDVFGYSAALPQLLQGSGIKYFCTTKISWNDTTRFPYDTFTWRGIDGTPVLAHFNSIHCIPDPAALFGQWNWVQHKDVQDRRLCAFGYGDGGGGPMAEMCETARRVTDLEGCPKTKYMSVSAFMKSIQRELTELPEWSGELYMEGHRGTLTSIAKVKRGNRKTEIALREAEFLSTLASLRGARYPAADLLDAWKTLLTNQFHDILPGSSIAAVNDEAIRSFDKCLTKIKTISLAALKRLAGMGSEESTELLVVNSLSWERKGELILNDAPKGMTPSAPEISAQWFDDIQGRSMLAVAGLTVPALGGTMLPMGRRRISGQSPFKLNGNTVETPHAIVKFDDFGRIASLVDKPSERDLVKPGGLLNTILVGEDVPADWDSWDIDNDHHLKMTAEQRMISRKVVANGPLQLRIRTEYKVGTSSSLCQDVVFHSSSRQIDFETVINWNEKHCLLKAGFDLNVFAESARHEIQYGHLERATHKNLPQDRAKFEAAAHKWTDISENGFGVALLNDCKYGIGVNGSTLRLSLMKSGTHPDQRGDQGTHMVTYSLLPHTGGFSVESVVRPAYELNIPVNASRGTARTKALESLLTVDETNVIVEAIKWAENGDGFVVRLYDAQKCGGQVTVRFGMPVKSVFETNLLEENPRTLALKNNTVTFQMRAFEVKTLLCRCDLTS